MESSVVVADTTRITFASSIEHIPPPFVDFAVDPKPLLAASAVNRFGSKAQLSMRFSGWLADAVAGGTCAFPKL